MASATPQRGTFIVIEGLDRSGKTTQVQRLVNSLSADGHKIKQLRFPDRTTVIGKMINSYLTSQSDLEDHVIHLLFSANRWEMATQIQSDISAGYTVICDRYYYSGMIYSLAKNKPDLGVDWARGPEVGLPRPDLVVFLDLKPEDAEKRGGFGDEKYEKLEMQMRVRELFKKFGSMGGEEEEDMVSIDAGGSVEDVEVEIKQVVEDRLQKLTGGLGRVGGTP